ncbi:hypothetical protein MK805_06075 [Shimazuella sp. AN120528]|uniref:hypothetical protein n=1 Tax=Shimazuella soli TaxID=1892854 RepID=UPI001F0E121D|nr:hypothetical protein [Shimazuella soli]MCH5584536.1 hypothetical protein [Shimazuella soli]
MKINLSTRSAKVLDVVWEILKYIKFLCFNVRHPFGYLVFPAVGAVVGNWFPQLASWEKLLITGGIGLFFIHLGVSGSQWFGDKRNRKNYPFVYIFIYGFFFHRINEAKKKMEKEA